jgi:hypothetical protein
VQLATSAKNYAPIRPAMRSTASFIEAVVAVSRAIPPSKGTFGGGSSQTALRGPNRASSAARGTAAPPALYLERRHAPFVSCPQKLTAWLLALARHSGTLFPGLESLFETSGGGEAPGRALL